MNTPWAVLLCQFKDDASPFTSSRALINRLLTSEGKGTFNIPQYFNDVSMGNIDLSASRVFGPLTVDVNHFEYTDSGASTWKQTVDRGELLKRVLKAASDGGVTVADFAGIVVIFNVAIGGPFGDDSPIRYAFTDDRPGDGAVEGGTPVFAHEMGHGLGLSHSRKGLTDNPPGEAWDYRDPWDIMSFGNAFAGPDPDFNRRAVGLNAWNMRHESWLDEQRVWRAGQAQFDQFVQLRPLMQYSLPGLIAAEVPSTSNAADRAFLVEFRLKQGWDDGISRSAVLVHRFSGGNSYLISGCRAGAAWRAAQDTPAGALGGWSELTDAIGLTDLTMASNADGRLEVFAVDGEAGLVWHNWQVAPNGAWQQWRRLFDAVGVKQIAAGRNADGRLEVFAVDDAAGLVWHNWQVSPSGGWHGWQRLFDAAGITQIAVASNADGRLEVFAVDGAAGLVWHNWQVSPSGGWHGWQRLFDAVGIKRIAVTSNADGRLEVFAVDRGAGLVWHNWQVVPSGGWHGWRRLFDAVGIVGIAVARHDDGRLELFAVDGQDGAPWRVAQAQAGGGFGGWQMMGDARGLGTIGVGRLANGRLCVVALDRNEGSAWQSFENAETATFGGWSIMGEKRGFTRLALGNNADGRLEVIAIDAEGHPDVVEGQTLKVPDNGTVWQVHVVKIDEATKTATIRLTRPV